MRKHNNDFNERTNTFFYKKKYISHTLFSKGLTLVVCERWAGDGDRLLFWPKVLLTIAELLPHLGWVAQPWVTEGCKSSVCKLILTLASCPPLTPSGSNRLGHLLPLFFRLFTQVHLLIDGSVEVQHVTFQPSIFLEEQ